MHLSAVEGFSKSLALLNLPKTAAVAVALSGGSDSVALTYLAKQAFEKVVAITVDHKLREESGSEAKQVGDIARSLGAEHVTLDLDWGDYLGDERERRHGPRVEMMARYRRYNLLLKECNRIGISTLLVGHHANDQIETMVQRMTKGSGIVGLGGMFLSSNWAPYPNIHIIRPLLDCSKTSLVDLCKTYGLQWVEDPTNQELSNPRNEIRQILTGHPPLQEGLADAMALFREAKTLSEPWIKKAMTKLALVDRRHGTVSFSASSYKALNPYVARSALAIWLRYTSASSVTVSRQNLHMLHNAVCQEHSTSIGASNACVLVPLPKAGRYMITRSGPQIKVPIRVGETVYWDNRFKIRLFQKQPQTPVCKSDEAAADINSTQTNSTAGTGQRQQRVYYVRNLHQRYNWYLSKGIRKIKRKVLVHPHVRSGLPLVMDEDERVVLIPHFKVMNHAEGIDCEVEYCPKWSMEQLLQYSYVAVDSLPQPDRLKFMSNNNNLMINTGFFSPIIQINQHVQ